jgi:P-type Ca2+ transporter type 2C
MNTSSQKGNNIGISQKEAADKLEKEGYNELPSSKPKSLLSIAIGVVKEPMFLLWLPAERYTSYLVIFRKD